MYLLLFAVFVWLFYKWSVNTFDYYEKLGVPYEKPIPLFGNMLNLVLGKQSMVELTQNSYDNFKKSK